MRQDERCGCALRAEPCDVGGEHHCTTRQAVCEYPADEEERHERHRPGGKDDAEVGRIADREHCERKRDRRERVTEQRDQLAGEEQPELALAQCPERLRIYRFLPGFKQVLRVERLLHPQVQVVAGRAELVLELAALQPADAVLAGDRAAEPQRELEQLVTRVVGALLLVEVLRREEERGVDVAVAGVTERQCRHVVARADLERLARDVAQPVERDGDVLAVGAAALREDRERRAAAPAPEVGDLGGLRRRVHGDRVVGERFLELGRRRGAPRPRRRRPR